MKENKLFYKVIKNFKKVEDYTYAVNCYGDVININTNILLHKKIANKKYHPYYAVYLKQKDDTSEWYLVHQLVAEYFVKKPKNNDNEELVPDHLDNDGLNNYYKNIEWKTRSQNISDGFKRGEFKNNYGENHKDTFITNKEAHKICKYLEKGFNYKKICEKMKFPYDKKHRTLLVRIKNKIAWKEVVDQYNISIETMYTDSQLDTIRKIPKILELYEKGYTVTEIFNKLYKDFKGQPDPKKETIRNICRHKIYKSVINNYYKNKDTSSTTIKS